MTVSRNYSSPLRAEQMEQTREKILDKVAELLADESVVDVTVADAAARAGVSVRTAYRYFPSKEALLDGLNDWMMNNVFSKMEEPQTLDDLPRYIASLVANWERHELFMRASRRPGLASEARKRRKQYQVRMLLKLVAEDTAHIDDREQRRMAAMLHELMSADAWLHMRDNWGFEADDCIAAMQWGLEALIAKLRKQQMNAKSGKR